MSPIAVVMIPDEYPATVCASGCSIAQIRYGSSAFTDLPVVRCTVRPARPFQVGPAEFWPFNVWQPSQLYFVESDLPCAMSAGVDATVIPAYGLSLPPPA